ncbi:MAG TPA: zf-HC2 domain-containing protein [Nitrospirota bacterium]|nr:zf-HC2 domain-containing protein [Nitrospirota bacterium]
MMHEEIRHKLSDYVDGSITGDEKKELEAHLESCPDCKEALRELKKTLDHLRSIEAVEPPAWMTQKIMAHVREAAEEKQGKLLEFARAAGAAARPARATPAAQAPAPEPAPAPPAREGFAKRLFAFFSALRPLQAVGVLFLAVVSFYLYRAMEPVKPAGQAPQMQRTDDHRATTQSAPHQDIPPQTFIKEQPAQPATQESGRGVPQSPGYRALDMKPQQEPPAPRLVPEPVPATPPAAGAGALPAEKRAPAFELFDAAVGAARKPAPDEAANADKEAYSPRLAKKKSEQAAEQSPTAAGAAVVGKAAQGDDVEERLADFFRKHDMPRTPPPPEGQQFTIAKVAAVPPELLQREMKNHTACRNVYRIDLPLQGTVQQYFYCTDNAQIRLIGKMIP